ncbi:MAG TPA: hypothetical protein VIH03_02980 [Nitrososphaerales archaeon]
MSEKIVIDKDILGWADEVKGTLLKGYDKNIIKVGSRQPDGEPPKLPQRSSDKQIASFCKDNGCDFATGDSTAYIHYFDVGVKTVRITRYDWWKKADKPIFLIEIVSD